MKDKLTSELGRVLADTYALYLKTQNYHWHVKGSNFRSLHQLFEEEYTDLAQAVDTIAERILTLGGIAPASFKQFMELTSIKDGDSQASSEHMIEDLYNDHERVIGDMNKAIVIAQEASDEGTIALLGERIAEHEKMRWMLGASKR